MNLENLIFMGFYGEGYFSGSSATVGIVCRKGQEEILSKYIDNLETKSKYFGELDGKHSDVEGEYFEIEDLESIIETLKEDNFSNDFMCSLKYSNVEVEDKEIIEDIIKLNKVLYSAKKIVKTSYQLFDEDGSLIMEF